MLPSSEVAGSGEVGGGISPRWLHCQAFHPISGRVRNAPKNVTRPPGPLPLPPPNLHVTGPKNQNPMRRAVKGPAQGGAEGKRHRPANNEENQSAVGIRSDFENGPKSQATRRSSALGDTGCQSEKSAKSPLGFKVVMCGFPWENDTSPCRSPDVTRTKPSRPPSRAHEALGDVRRRP